MSASSNIPTTDATLRLRDGRTLGYLAVGPSDGPAVLHCHGHGSSRLEARLIAERAWPLGVRLIGLDRPGIGRSDPKSGYRILDWPADVAEAADQLGIERFAVTGLSGGGAYALACTSKIAQHLTACGLISTLTPVTFIRKAGPRWMRATWRMEARFSWLFRPLLRLSRRLTGSDAASIEKKLLRYRARLGAADQALLGETEL